MYRIFFNNNKVTSVIVITENTVSLIPVDSGISYIDTFDLYTAKDILIIDTTEIENFLLNQNNTEE